MLLVKNMVIEWPGDDKDNGKRLERILWISPNREYLYIFDLIDESALPVRRSYIEIVAALDNAEAIIIQHDDEFYFRPDEDYSKKQLTRREKIWHINQPIILSGETAFTEERWPLIEEASRNSGRCFRLIYDDLRTYWRVGQIKNAFIPRYDKRGISSDKEIAPDAPKRGRPIGSVKGYPGVINKPEENPEENQPEKGKGINVGPQIRKRLQKGYREFYVSGECTTLREARERTLRKYFKEKVVVGPDGIEKTIMPPLSKLPSLPQFIYHCHKPRNKTAVLISRVGLSRYEADYAPKEGSAPLMAFAPGSWFFIDSTPSRFPLVDPFNRRHVIGYATVYFVKDLFSFMIVGFLVTLEEPSWICEVLAFQTVVMDKVELCKKYGVLITPDEWPCYYLPEFLLSDRGEGESDDASNLPNFIGVQVSNTPPYRPDYKGPVELDFFLLETYLKDKVAGAGQSAKKRGDKKAKKLPSLTLDDFTRGVIEYIRFYNKSHIIEGYPKDKFMIADEVDTIPIKLWEYGIESRGGALRTMDPELVYRSLLPREQAKVGRQGIEFSGLHFTSEYCKDNHLLLKPSKETGKQKNAKIAYDPRTTNYVFLCNKKGRVIEMCPLSKGDAEGYKDLSWAEYADVRSRERERKLELENDKFQASIELHDRMEHISKPAEEATIEDRERAGMRRNAPQKNRREYKAIDRRRRRIQDTQVDTPKEVAELPEVERVPLSELMPEEYKSYYIGPTDHSDVIDELFEEEDDNGQVY